MLYTRQRLKPDVGHRLLRCQAFWDRTVNGARAYQEVLGGTLNGSLGPNLSSPVRLESDLIV